MEREEFITATEIAFERIMNPTRGLRPALLEVPMAEGKWSMKELAAHFAFWNTLRIQALEAVLNGEEFNWSPYRNSAEWNARAVEKAAKAPLKRVLNDLRLTHITMVEAYRRVPDEILAQHPETRDRVLAAPDHYLHHLAEIETWAAEVRQPIQ